MQLTYFGLKGHVFIANRQRPRWVVKFPRAEHNELAIYERLLRDPVSSKYVMPGDIIEDPHGPLILSPYFSFFDNLLPSRWSLNATLTFFDRVLEVCSHEPIAS